jgi:hypothetical protein
MSSAQNTILKRDAPESSGETVISTPKIQSLFAHKGLRTIASSRKTAGNDAAISKSRPGWGEEIRNLISELANSNGLEVRGLVSSNLSANEKTFRRKIRI